MADSPYSFVQSQLSSVWPEWTIIAACGKGTFGHVYEILRNDLGPNYKCALKVLQLESEESDPALDEFVQNVSREIDTMMKLKGAPNIVAIEDYAVLREKGLRTILIRMELLESVEKIRKKAGGLDLKQTLQLGLDICNALISCEKRNIIHRDIKLSNIFYSDKGGYKLGDFGISRTMDSIHEKVSMSSAGTIQYIAPEVYFGYKYDNTADIYSLGISLYILLNNNLPPLCGEYNLPPEQISMSMFHEANMRRLRGEHFPGPACADQRLSSIISAACDPDPEKRFQSAWQFRDALRAYIENRPIPLPENGSLMNDNTGILFGSGTTGIPDDKTSVLINAAEQNTQSLGHNSGLRSRQDSGPGNEHDRLSGSAAAFASGNRSSTPSGTDRNFQIHERKDRNSNANSPLPKILAVLVAAILICTAVLYFHSKSSPTDSADDDSAAEAVQEEQSGSDTEGDDEEDSSAAAMTAGEVEMTEAEAAEVDDTVSYVINCVDTDGNVLNTDYYIDTDGSSVTVYAPDIAGYQPTKEETTITLRAGEDNEVIFIYTPEDTGPAVDIPDYDTLIYNGHTYYAYETSAVDSFREAQEYCRSRGGHLAIINDGFENSELYDYVFRDLGLESAYFGLTDEGHEGHWVWVDGTPLDYDNWLDGQPDNLNGTEDYALFYYKDTPYTWNDGDFGKDPNTGKVIFLIEWDLDITP